MLETVPEPGPGERRRIREPRELVAWRLDAGGDAYALLEWAPRGLAAALGRLTRAERDVAGLLAAGLSNAEIASRRMSSPRTVANQATSVFRKLGVRSRIELYALFATGGGTQAKP
jgi:DNA-binding NarL/FixJ family response regulator